MVAHRKWALVIVVIAEDHKLELESVVEVVDRKLELVIAMVLIVEVHISELATIVAEGVHKLDQGTVAAVVVHKNHYLDKMDQEYESGFVENPKKMKKKKMFLLFLLHKLLLQLQCGTETITYFETADNVLLRSNDCVRFESC